MSKIGKIPVTILEGVTVNLDQNKIIVKGPKGELSLDLKPRIKIEIKEDKIIVSRKNDEKKVKALHGTIRNLINNMVIGVVEGYSKKLKLVGTGYRVKASGKNLEFSLGFSHPVVFEEVEGVSFKIEGQNGLEVSGIDKYLVGQVAANIRALRPPEPYKGKGIRYSDEQVIKKAGKAAKTEA
jgi:large subunit ribosomal protein L6